MLTSSEDYFYAKDLQVNYSKFLHLNKSVAGGPFMTSFYSLSAQVLKIAFLYKVGTWATQS